MPLFVGSSFTSKQSNGSTWTFCTETVGGQDSDIEYSIPEILRDKLMAL